MLKRFWDHYLNKKNQLLSQAKMKNNHNYLLKESLIILRKWVILNSKPRFRSNLPIEVCHYHLLWTWNLWKGIKHPFLVTCKITKWNSANQLMKCGSILMQTRMGTSKETKPKGSSINCQNASVEKELNFTKKTNLINFSMNLTLMAMEFCQKGNSLSSSS